MLYLEAPVADSGGVDLADGLTEELITRLSQIGSLRVTSRYAALRYRGRAMVDPQVTGHALGVAYVLQGTLRRGADRIRVHVALTDVSTGFNVWAQTFDQSLHDVFALEDSVSAQVATAVHGRLTGVERAQLAVAPRTNSQAYRAYLAGRAAIRARTAAAGARAIADYQRAIGLDANFAPAYAGLAYVYNIAADWGWEVPAVPYDSLGTFATRAAARAIALDSANSETWLGAAMAARAVRIQRLP